MASKKHYLKLVEEAQKKRLKLTKEQERHIRNLYREVAKNLERKLSKINPETLTYDFVYNLRKELKREIDSITKSIYSSVKQKIEKAIDLAVGPQETIFKQIGEEYNLGLGDMLDRRFNRVNTKVISELVSGKIYRDNAGLSERLWKDSKSINNEIQNIIAKGIAEKKSAYELAKDLEAFVNPDAKKDWDWSKVYPGSRRKIDYNAQRLARTSISHAYQMSLKRDCGDNPFVKGIRWNSVLQHGRTCELCRERHGRIYKVEDLPLDHP